MEDYEFRDYVDLNYVVFNVTIDDVSDLITFGDFKRFLQPVEGPFQFLFNQITHTDDAAKLILTALSLAEVPLYSVATTFLDSKENLHYTVTNQGCGRAPLDDLWYPDDPDYPEDPEFIPDASMMSETVSLKIRDKAICQSEDKIRRFLESISDAANLVIINKVDVSPGKIAQALFTLLSLDVLAEAYVFEDDFLGDNKRFQYHINDHYLTIGEKKLKVWY